MATTKSAKVEPAGGITSKISQLKSSFPTNIISFRPNKLVYVAIIVLGIVILITVKRGWFIAATVNGTPISTLSLLSRISAQYKTQTLEQMINEQLIWDEVKKNRVVVTEADVNQKISQLEANVGGAQALDNLLTQQGQNRTSLKQQVRIQLAIERLYDKEASVSASEVTDFITQNKDQLQASDSAGQTTEATQALKQQKISQVFSEKFKALKEQAKIQIF
ncbi:MAG: hypothetical protein V1808_03055 [Candidatus Daviesbacteria bacterium]